jgi:hypothetical protein
MKCGVAGEIGYRGRRRPIEANAYRLHAWLPNGKAGADVCPFSAKRGPGLIAEAANRD